MTTSQKEQVTLLRSQGENYTRIADMLSLSENTVKSYCWRNNVVVCTEHKQSAHENACDHCGKPLVHTPGSKHKRFCSDKCRMRWWARHPEAMQRKAVYRFICPVCGKEFVSYINPKRNYCSRACFGAARKTARG